MKKVIVIVGPTGVGKTKLSIELAKKYNGEIINADSTQVYKGLDIATAKIKEEEKEGIKHYLFDIKEIEEDYSVFDYQKDCRSCINDILEKEKTPIIVGGTGLYIKSALYDYVFEKEEINNDYNDLSNEKLYEILLSIDSQSQIHKNNRKRIIRAINYYENTGKLLSENLNGSKILYDCIFIGLTIDREILYDRINKRVDQMVNIGLINEAKKLYESNIRTKAVMTPIGYKELFEYFDSDMTLEESIDLIKQKSRNYAKRQYTWFKNQMDIKWFKVDFENFINTVDSVCKYIDKIRIGDNDG